MEFAKFGTVSFLLVLACLQVAAPAGAQTWTQLSTELGDLPSPGPGTEQTGCHVLDVDGDGRNDFVIAERTQSPCIVWYRRTLSGWDRYLVEDQVLPLEAGGHFTDIDGDGDLDLSFGGDYGSNRIWWWANPSPAFHPDSTWTRRLIKDSGSNMPHDQLFGDFDGDGRDELVFWNQLAGGQLMLAEIPADPLGSAPWTYEPIFTGAADSEGLAAADMDLDGRIDLVGAGFWFFADDGGGYSANPIAPGRTFSRVAVGQLIPGGRPEVVFCPGDSDGPLSWYQWLDGAWLERSAIDLVIHGHTLQIEDIDADGFQDIFVGEMHTPGAGSAARVRVLFGDGRGEFRTETVATGFGVHESRIADLDGDGDLDILGKPFSAGAPGLYLWMQEGVPAAQWNFTGLVLDPAPHPVPAGRIVDLQLADIDGDSWIDIWLPGSAGADDLEQMHWYRGPHWERHAMNPGNFGAGTWGDIDGDGDLDLAVATLDDVAGVAWLENTGTPAVPGWPAHVILAAIEDEPEEIVAGDLNRDGRLDLVISCGNDEVRALLAPTDPATPWSPVVLGQGGPIRCGLAVGDIDRDGDPDLLWGNGWLENPGDALLSPWTDHPVDAAWPAANRVLLTDLDHDGRLDAILGSAAGAEGVAWYAGPPDPRTGYWAPTPVGDQAFSGIASLQAGDFDADGDQDIFVAEERSGENPDRIVIFENSGGTAAVWLETPGPATGSHRAKVADLDGDGDLDIAGKNRDGTEGALVLQMWRNDLDPTLELDQWQRHVIDSARPWRAIFITTGDIDRDGLQDVLNGAWWYRNPGSPAGMWDRFELGTELKNLATVFDFDRDGDLDVLGTRGIPWDESSQFVWTRNDGSGNFTLLENIPDGVGSFLQGTTAGTFTIDRRLDHNPDEVALSWEDGGGGIQMLTTPVNPAADAWTWRNISATTQFEGIDSGDIDRDGDRDLLLGNIWLRNDPPGWTTFLIEDTAEEPDRVLLVDLDRDGKLDALVGFEEWPDELVWYEQPADPTGAWPRHDIATLFGPMSLDAADLDKDGDIDIVVGEHNVDDPAASRVLVYENIYGAVIWQPHLVYTGDEHHMGTQLLDVDNDSDLDIVSFGWNHGEVVLYENQATPGGSGLPLAPVVTMQPPGGLFSCPVAVTLTTDAPGVAIRYTLDGSVPTESSPLFEQPIDAGADFTLRARSFALGFRPGPVAQGDYEFAPDTVEPRLKTVVSAGVPEHVLVQFSEPVDSFSAAAASNYTIAPGATVLEARPLAGLDRVELVTSGLSDGATYSLSVSGLQDQACPPNPLAPGQTAYFPYSAWLRTDEGAVVIYDFAEGQGVTVCDRSDIDPPLDLTIADPDAVAWSPGRLDVLGETIIVSEAAAQKVNAACRATNEITIETWISPADLTLNGPGRIVTVSGDQFGRNFTIGQGVFDKAGDQIDARLTLTTTSPNGEPSLPSGAGTLSGGLTQIVFTRDATGRARLYIDGQLVVEVQREGTMANWITAYPLALANEVGIPGDRYWLGGYHLVAVFARCLAEEEVVRNFLAGVPDPAVSATVPTPIGSFRLHANVPNPFNPVTRITFDLPGPRAVDLAVFDVAGRLVRRLLVGAPCQAGRHSLSWDGRDNHGRTVGAGVYFYRIVAGTDRDTRKMLLLK